MLYSYIDKLILKTSYDSENEIKYPNNFDNFSDVDDYILKSFFFRFYSAYCFCISEIIFVGVRRRRFDQTFVDLFRTSR